MTQFQFARTEKASDEPCLNAHTKELSKIPLKGSQRTEEIYRRNRCSYNLHWSLAGKGKFKLSLGISIMQKWSCECNPYACTNDDHGIKIRNRCYKRRICESLLYFKTKEKLFFGEMVEGILKEPLLTESGREEILSASDPSLRKHLRFEWTDLENSTFQLTENLKIHHYYVDEHNC